MINAIRMDVSRIFLGRAFKVILCIWVALIMLVTFVNMKQNDKYIPDDPQYVNGTDYLYQDNYEYDGEIIESQSCDYSKAPIFALAEDATAGGIFLFLVSLFCAIFVTAERSTGFLKNISNHVPSRTTLVISKAVAIAFYNLFMMVVMFLCFGFVQLVMQHHIIIGGFEENVRFFGLMYIMNTAFCLVAMALTIFFANDAAAISFTCLLATGVSSLIYQLIDFLINKYTSLSDFFIEKYTIIGNLNSVSAYASSETTRNLVLLVICYTAAALVVGGFIYRKREVR